jgi:hypothetical protein
MGGFASRYRPDSRNSRNPGGERRIAAALSSATYSAKKVAINETQQSCAFVLGTRVRTDVGCWRRAEEPCGLTAFLYQRMRDYCIGMISSRWYAKGANVCGAGGYS